MSRFPGRYCLAVFDARNLDELCDSLSRRPPVVTLLYVALCVGLYYGGKSSPSWGDKNAYLPPVAGAEPPWRTGAAADAWYTPVSAMFMHMTATHLWSNAVVMLTAGTLLEVTEGSAHVVLVAFGSGVVGFGYHGIFSTARVRGASGAIYGVLWSQLALLALNWREMLGRWLRLFIAVVLLAVELMMYHVQRDRAISYESHAFGALAGVAVSLVSGHNVVVHPGELLLNLGGAISYTVLDGVLFASSMWTCALWGAVLVPLLLFETLRHVRRELRGSGERMGASGSAGQRGATVAPARGVELVREQQSQPRRTRTSPVTLDHF
jgi:membrane associated rhomboid family serine protease